MKGIRELWKAIKDYMEFLEESGEIERKRKFRAEEEIKTIISGTIVRKISERLTEDEVTALIDRIVRREMDPYSAADLVLEKALGVKV